MGPVEAPFMLNLFEEIQTVSSDKTLPSLSYFPIFPSFLRGRFADSSLPPVPPKLSFQSVLYGSKLDSI